MVFPTFGKGGGSNKDTTFHTLTLVRLKGVSQGGLTMLSDLDMSGNNLANAQSVDTANLTSSNGVINVINADVNIENNELRVKTFKVDEITSKTDGGRIKIRSDLQLADVGAVNSITTAMLTDKDNPAWSEWNKLETGDISCRTLRYTELIPSIAGIILKVYTAKNSTAQTLLKFYINDYNQNYVLGQPINYTNRITLFTSLANVVIPTSSNKYVYSASIVVNNLPDNYYAHFRVMTEGSTEFDDTYINGTKDTAVTLSGRFQGPNITKISVYGLYSYSPVIASATDETDATTEKYVTVRNVALSVFECTEITIAPNDATFTLTVNISRIVEGQCIFVRLNNNEATQQLASKDTANVVFTVLGNTQYKITVFIPHNVNLQISNTSTSLVGTITNANITANLIFDQNFVLTVNNTTFDNDNGELKLRLKSLTNETYDKNLILPYNFAGEVDFPVITDSVKYELSVDADNSNFVNYQINAATFIVDTLNLIPGVIYIVKTIGNLTPLDWHTAGGAILDPETQTLTAGSYYIIINVGDDPIPTDTWPEFTVTPSVGNTFRCITGRTLPNTAACQQLTNPAISNEFTALRTTITGGTVTLKSAPDPESFLINTSFTVNLSLTALYKITVTVPALTNGPLTLKLDYTGEEIVFSSGGTKSFIIGVPRTTSIIIYSVLSPKYVGISNTKTINGNTTIEIATVTSLYLFNPRVYGIIAGKSAIINLKAPNEIDLPRKFYNVVGTTEISFSVTLTGDPDVAYNSINTKITPPLGVPAGTYVISGSAFGASTGTTNDLVFYYDGNSKIISGISKTAKPETSYNATYNGYFDIEISNNNSVAYTGNTTISSSTTRSATLVWVIKGTKLDGLDGLDANDLTFKWTLAGASEIIGTSKDVRQTLTTDGIINFPSYFALNSPVTFENALNNSNYKNNTDQYIIGVSYSNSIEFIPLKSIKATLTNVTKTSNITLSLSPNVNNQPSVNININTLLKEANFNIIENVTNINITFDPDDYFGPTSGSIIANNKYQIILPTVDVTIDMIPFYQAILDLTLMEVTNSKITFDYNNVSYAIIKTDTSYTTTPTLTQALIAGRFILSNKIAYDSPLPPITVKYFTNKDSLNEEVGFAALNWQDDNKIVDNNETLSLSFRNFISVVSSGLTLVSLYGGDISFANIFNNLLVNKSLIQNTTLNHAFFLNHKYFLVSTKNIPNFYGSFITSEDLTLTEEQKFVLTTDTSVLLTDVNFNLVSIGDLNHFDYNEIMKNVGDFKTPLYVDDEYSVGATYISAPNTTGVTLNSSNIFNNILVNNILVDGITVTVTIDSSSSDYNESMLTHIFGGTDEATYTIPGNLLGGQYLINDLTFTYIFPDSFTDVSGSTVRLYSNVQCNTNLFVNVATPIGGTYAGTTITYVSGNHNGAFTIDGSLIGGGDDLTEATIDSTTKAISGTYAGNKPQYFTNVPASTGANTFDVKWTPDSDPIITLAENNDNYSGATGQPYILENFDGEHDLTFTLKGISPPLTGTIAANTTLTYTPTYNISGANEYIFESATLSVNTNPVINATITTNPYTINDLKLVQGTSRPLTIISSKHLFSDFTLSKTLTTPNSDQSGVDLIARYQDLNFSIVRNDSTQNVIFTNVKRTGVTATATGSIINPATSTTINVDLLGATVNTYEYTLALSDNNLTKVFTSTAVSFVITLAKLTITGSTEFTNNNIKFKLPANSPALPDFEFTASKIYYLLSAENYTLSGTYSGINSTNMNYTIDIPSLVHNTALTLSVHSLSITFPLLLLDIKLELYVKSNNDFIPYQDATVGTVATGNTISFTNIPRGCIFKLKHAELGAGNSVQNYAFTLLGQTLNIVGGTGTNSTLGWFLNKSGTPIPGTGTELTMENANIAITAVESL